MIYIKFMIKYSIYIFKEEYNKWKNENELGTQKLQLFQAIFNDDK